MINKHRAEKHVNLSDHVRRFSWHALKETKGLIQVNSSFFQHVSSFFNMPLAQRLFKHKRVTLRVFFGVLPGIEDSHRCDVFARVVE